MSLGHRRHGETASTVDAIQHNAIHRNAARQIRLLDNLAALADLQMGMVPRVRRLVDITFLLSRLRPGVAEELAEAGIELLLPALTVPMDTSGDPDRLWHALRELVRNAIEASPKGASVGILTNIRAATRPAPGAVTIEVVDSGRGIPAEELAAVLEPFGRTEWARKHQLPGTGLGLTVADGVVRAHGGDLSISSGPGRGTRVLVRLPLR